MSESNIKINDLEDLPTEEVMRTVCAQHGCPTNMSDDIVDRINLYQNLILNRKILDPDKY